jgi:hypothetical protein
MDVEWRELRRIAGAGCGFTRPGRRASGERRGVALASSPKFSPSDIRAQLMNTRPSGTADFAAIANRIEAEFWSGGLHDGNVT